MKNIYKKGRKIHPSPPPPPEEPLLSLLPATILTLTTVLSPEDKEVLAYLISCCGTAATADRKTTHKANDHAGDNGGSGEDHAPTFECNCFRCYTSFWARWDMSPNRQVIHEIIEAYEEWLFQKKKKIKKSGSIKKKKRGNYNNNNNNNHSDYDNYGNHNRDHIEQEVIKKDESSGELESVDQLGCSGEVDQDELEKGTVRKIIGFIGEKIWGTLWSKN